jgi:RHS repeat-associated protein
LGNWSSVTTDGSTQTRTANQQNQITSISGQTTPLYDLNGNMLLDQTGNKQFIYDAWNRLVQVRNASNQTLLESFAYDALGRRIIENPGTARDLFFSAAWQVIEERVAGNAQEQYIWSPVYVDAMIERDRDADGNPANGLEERLYVQQDANWNVTALISTSGAVQERYIEDPYGQASVLAPDWSSRGSSSFAWNYLHQGGRYDSTSGLYNFRNRDYSPTLGRWVSQDPLGYGAGDANLYRYVENSPANSIDPSGLAKNPGYEPAEKIPDLPALRPPAYVGPGPDGWQSYYWNGSFWMVPLDGGPAIRLGPRPGAPLFIPGLPPPTPSYPSMRAWTPQDQLRHENWQQEQARQQREQALRELDHQFFMWVWHDLGPIGFLGFKGTPPALEFEPRLRPNDGRTPQGRALSPHYEWGEGPPRNVPGSVVDHVINNYPGQRAPGGTRVYYDRVNDVTIVTGNDGIVSARRGPPRPDQRPCP